MIDILPDGKLALLTCAEMSTADAATIAGGIPGTGLMETAGRVVASAVVRHYPHQPVTVLCGPGSNGGDGFVAARRLQEAGWPVRLGLLGSVTDLKGDAAWAVASWKGVTEPISRDLLEGRPLVVDALFGAGLKRPIEGVAAELIAALNEQSLPVVAVDVPSGLHGDTGEVLGCAPHAEVTVTFFRAKPGHLSLEGLRRCGDLQVVDIGIPDSVLQTINPRQWRDGPGLWQHLLRRDGLRDNKYVRGHLTILGGSAATGASRLSALAGRRIGAGLVTIASPASAMAIYQTAEPGNLIVEATEDGAFGELLKDERRNAVLIGPGSGVNGRTRQAVLAALDRRRAAVLDADAITTFAREPRELFKAIKGPVLLTPHEGEFKRIFPSLGTSLGAGGGKLARVREAARLSGATVLLKGPDTVIASPDGRAVINVHAPASLATAGSGDVLAGMAAGLMTQGLAPLAAASAAAWLHGECAYRFGRPGLIAEDIVNSLPEALATAMN